MSIFSSIKVQKPRRTSFNLSHEVKLTTEFGRLTPFFCQEVLPGDTFKVSAETLVRMAPMLAPIMHRVNIYTHFFFVPYRLVWDDWKEFITGGENGTSKPPFPIFQLTGNIKKSSLSDYLGVPTTDPLKRYTDSDTTAYVNALPYRAYWLIWNEYYRDQNLTEPNDFYKGGSVLKLAEGQQHCKYRCWEKDYFTSALPNPQRLPNPVTVPVVGEAPVVLSDKGGQQNLFDASTQKAMATQTLTSNNGILSGSQMSNNNALLDPNGTLSADLEESSGVTINDLRRAFSLQKWLENNARAGARYIEQILSHFGVRSSDARLQRPEFLGGGKTPMVISEIMQTSESNKTPQGSYAGAGTSYGKTHSFKRFFEEHGLIIGILSVVPRSSYQNGMPRLFLKSNKFDFYWPEFAHLGEQEVMTGELFYDNTHPAPPSQVDGNDNHKTFGYQPRYAEYRFIPNSVHGDFRDNLSYWHMGRIFNSLPGLNTDFVTIKPDSGSTNGINRIFAVGNVDHLWIQMYVNCKALRPLPKYGTPGI